jgi:hypothetical protein
VTLPNAGLQAYLHKIAQHRLLSPAEELRLAQQLADGRNAVRQLAAHDLAPEHHADLTRRIEWGLLARRRLIDSNLRLVISIARRFTEQGLEPYVIRAGNIGLQAGVDAYDLRIGCRLTIYLYWWIHQAITRAVAPAPRLPRQSVLADLLGRRTISSSAIGDSYASAVRLPARISSSRWEVRHYERPRHDGQPSARTGALTRDQPHGSTSKQHTRNGLQPSP